MCRFTEQGDNLLSKDEINMIFFKKREWKKSQREKKEREEELKEGDEKESSIVSRVAEEE